MNWFIISLLFTVSAFGFGGSSKPSPKPKTSPVVSISPDPVPSESYTAPPEGIPVEFVKLGTNLGPSVKKAYAQTAIDKLNKVVANGCFREQFLKHTFKSLKNIDGPQVKTRLEAYDRLIKGAPYALDLRWFYKGWPSNGVGYTYVYKNSKKSQGSETRIWSNTRYMTSTDRYAAHLAHELSHQARAGGFVHYDFHQGSVPYETGDIAAICIKKL